MNILTNAALVLKAMAHPTRLAVVHLLTREENMSVNKMVEAIDCEQSLLSHHLTHMKMVGLLKTERDGRTIYYSLRKKEFYNLLSWLDKYSDSIAEREITSCLKQVQTA